MRFIGVPVTVLRPCVKNSDVISVGFVTINQNETDFGFQLLGEYMKAELNIKSAGKQNDIDIPMLLTYDQISDF